MFRKDFIRWSNICSTWLNICNAFCIEIDYRAIHSQSSRWHNSKRMMRHSHFFSLFILIVKIYKNIVSASIVLFKWFIIFVVLFKIFELSHSLFASWWFSIRISLSYQSNKSLFICLIWLFQIKNILYFWLLIDSFDRFVNETDFYSIYLLTNRRQIFELVLAIDEKAFNELEIIVIFHDWYTRIAFMWFIIIEIFSLLSVLYQDRNSFIAVCIVKTWLIIWCVSKSINR